MLLSEPRYIVAKQEKELSEKYRLVLEEVGAGRDVLELGCYDGSFSRHLVARRNRVVGVDNDVAAIQKAAAVCAEAYRCDLNDPEGLFSGPLRGRRFSRILLMDVLEHLVSPERLMARLTTHLEPGGAVIVTLPNIAFWGIRKMLFRGAFIYRDVGILDRGLLRFFTYETARSFLEGAGWRIERWEPLSYQAPLVGRLGLRGCSLTRAGIRRLEAFVARRYPNFYCMQFYFRLTPG